jgi:hypothetical protein
MAYGEIQTEALPFPDQRFGLAEVEAVAQAYMDAGMRAVLGLRVFDEAFADILPTGTVPP